MHLGMGKNIPVFELYLAYAVPSLDLEIARSSPRAAIT